jgi:hypothetical protein
MRESSGDRTIALHECPPAAFEQLLQWVYVRDVWSDVLVTCFVGFALSF